ncbi:hypothetical protein [Streptomyces mayteni]
MSGNTELIRFRDGSLQDIQTGTLNQRQEYEDIWNNVRQQLLGLIEQGQVDASIGQALEERNQEFQRQSAGFDESVLAQNQAVGQVQAIGNAGGEAMVRAAMGGR